MKFSAAALVSTVFRSVTFRDLLFSGTIVFSAKNPGVLGGYVVDTKVDFVRNGRNKYYIENDALMNWASHEATANMCGGHLASITSGTEMAFVQAEWKYSVDLFMWLGGYQPDTCNEVSSSDCWVYSDGSTWWENWGPGQPDNAGSGEHCSNLIVTDTELASFNDHVCGSSFKGLYIFDAGIEVFADGSCNEVSSAPTTNPSETPSLSSQPSQTPSMTPPGVSKWFISNEYNTTQDIVSSNIIAIYMPFNTSNREIGVDVFKKDCVSPFESTEYPYFIVDKSEPTSSNPDGFIQFNTMLEMNVTSIIQTDYWNTFTDGTRGGWAEACVETSLILQDNIDLGNVASPLKVTFKSSILNISVSLTTAFEVDGISIEREIAQEENVETDFSEFIMAYECDEESLYTPKVSTTYNQGDEITICVTDNSGDIVQVEEFVNLVVDQSNNTPYNFINNGLWNPDITTLVCVDGSTSTNRRVCYAKIRVLARFFQSQNLSDLSISGTVFVVRDGRRIMRKLHGILPSADKTNNINNLDISGRRVKEKVEGGNFEVKIRLTNTNEDATSNGMVERTATSLISLVAGAALLV